MQSPHALALGRSGWKQKFAGYAAVFREQQNLGFDTGLREWSPVSPTVTLAVPA